MAMQSSYRGFPTLCVLPNSSSVAVGIFIHVSFRICSFFVIQWAIEPALDLSAGAVNQIYYIRWVTSFHMGAGGDPLTGTWMLIKTSETSGNMVVSLGGDETDRSGFMFSAVDPATGGIM